VSTALPPLPPTPAAPSQTVLPQVLTAAVDSLPPEIAALPPGAILDAVVQQQARNLLLVATDAGTLTLRTRGGLALPEGAQLSLQVIQNDGQLSLKLVAVNGRAVLPGGLGLSLPAQAGLPFDPTAGEAAIARGPAENPAATVRLAQPSGGGIPAGLSAVLLRPAAAMPAAAAPATPNAAAALPPGITADLPPGTVFIVRIAGVTPPQSAAIVPQGATPPDPATAAASTIPMDAAPPEAEPPPPAAPSDLPAPAGPGAAAIPAAPTAPGPVSPPVAAAPPSPVPPAPAPAVLTGTVVGHGPGAQALVQSPAGLLSLPAAAELPVGAGVALDLLAPPVPPPPANPATAAAPPETWPALAETMAALSAGDDQPALQALARAVPQLQPQLAANLSVFASALRSGDFGKAVGEPVIKALERTGRRDLVDRLKGDFKALSARAARPLAGGEWQGFTLPLFNGAVVDPVQLFVRHPPEETESGGGRKGQEHRFLVEVTLTRLGRIQFDGLIQREAKRFDLILRTAQPLNAAMRQDILGLFNSSSEAVGTTGTVAFQSGGRFVDLPPPAVTGATRLMV